MLLFSGLGLFSYFLIANYTDFSPKTAEAFLFMGSGCLHHTRIQPGGIFHTSIVRMGKQAVCY